MKNIFDISNYNLISDNKYYYFFRALEPGDLSDIDNNINTTNGDLSKLRTDRERYQGIPKYNADSDVSLEEVADHIKMHYRTDTNCISLTSNANVALLYGRSFYDDKYVMVKIEKDKVDTDIINAGSYMIGEVNKMITELINNKELSDEVLEMLWRIDNADTSEELDFLIKGQDNEKKHDEMFEKGIVHNFSKIRTVDYSVLTEEQNFEKKKLITKINCINKQLLPNMSNKLLVQTIGNAFSSLEFIHYKDVESDKLVNISKEVVDMFALLQQLSKNDKSVDYLKEALLSNVNKNLKIYSMENPDVSLDKNYYSIDRIYELTNGEIDYKTAIDLYKKSFYLAKSKLRAHDMANILDKIIKEESFSNELVNRIRNNTFGIEPEIFSKKNSNKMKVSESVSLDLLAKDEGLFNYINTLSLEELKELVNHPNEKFKENLENFSFIDKTIMKKDEYYANALIDIFDWKSIGVVEFEQRHKDKLVKKILENDFIKLYEDLKSKNYNDKKISNLILTSVIRNVEIDELKNNETFTVEQLDYYLGYYKVKGTYDLNLRDYQSYTLKNINKSFDENNFTAAILPTGAGKTFVSLAKMLEYRNKDILYLAPNDVILNQVEDYIIKYIVGDTTGKSKREIIKEVFPNLELKTYSSLIGSRENMIDSKDYHKTIEHEYDLIIMDELHRSGAIEWNRKVLELMSNQNEKVKVLGITATPERDTDFMNMADEWADFFGYSEENINKEEHIAIKMNLEDAIKLGYVVNPKLIECNYTLLEENGYIDQLTEKIKLVQDEEQKEEYLKKLNKIRNELSQADGIEKIIGDNTKLGGRYIVFCPVVNKTEQLLEDEDGNINDYRITGEDVIEEYKNKIREYYKNYYNKSDEDINSMLEFHSVLGTTSKSRAEYEINKFEESNPEKIKFMVVMNKLNEGSHAKNDGMIWFRPLDENSTILYSQQMGRVIYSVDPLEKIKDEDKPVIIDVTCNYLRINSVERNQVSDLENIKLVKDWIDEHDGIIPNINSINRVESSYGMLLKNIQTKYIDYINDSSLIDNLRGRKQSQTKTILDIGNDIGLWDYQFPPVENNKGNNGLGEFGRDDFTLSVTDTIRDLVDLTKDVNSSLYMSPGEKVLDLIKTIHELHRLPKSKKKNKGISEKTFKDGTDQRYFYDCLRKKRRKIKKKYENIKNPKFIEDETLVIEWCDEIDEQIYFEYKKEITEKLNILKNTICELHRLPKRASENDGVAERTFSDGTDQYNFYYYIVSKYKKNKSNMKKRKYQDKKMEMWLISSIYDELCTILYREKERDFFSKINNTINAIKNDSYNKESREFYQNLKKKTKKMKKEQRKTIYKEDEFTSAIMGELQIDEAIKQREKEKNKEKENELIKTILNLHRLPKSASKNNGKAERVYDDGTSQSSFYYVLQRKFNEIEREHVANPKLKYTEEDLETINSYNRIQNVLFLESLYVCEYKTNELIEAIDKKYRLPKIEEFFSEIDDKDLRYFYETLSKDVLEIKINRKNSNEISYTEKEQTQIICWKKIEEALYQANIKLYKLKTEELIKSIHNNYGLPEHSKEYSCIDATDLRYFYENLQKSNKKIQKKYQTDEKKEYTELEQVQLSLYQKVKIHREFVAKRKKLKVKKICAEYNIDIKKNKEILNFSYDEVDAKIRYLEDNDLSIVNENGVLHDIFFVSEDVLKNTYGFTLEELFDKYIYSQVESRLK